METHIRHRFDLSARFRLWPAGTFWTMQLLGFGGILLCICMNIRTVPPVIISSIVGVLWGQCGLAAAFAVLGKMPFIRRAAFSCAIVQGEVITLLIIYKLAHGIEFQLGNFIAIGFLTLLIWVSVQIPLWCVRLLLNVRIVDSHEPNSGFSSTNRYTVRDLIVITFVVAVAFGLGRLLIPVAVIHDLFTVPHAIWMFVEMLALAVGLLVATTIALVLSPFNRNC